MKLPNFFLVGAPKCGTSAMYEALRRHPDIFMSPRKEPHYFGRDHHRINHTAMSAETYRSMFAGACHQARVGDASTSYLHSQTAAEEIKAFEPAARIIVMLRNPVEVMHAYHATNLYGGFEYIPDFEQALLAEDARKHGNQWPPRHKGILENLFYREVVAYPEQLERFWKVFGRDDVHVIIHDDYRADPRAVYAGVFDFLSVESTFTPSIGVVNANRERRSLRVQRFLDHPPRLLRGAAHLLCPEAVRRPLVNYAKRMNEREAPRRPLAPELLARLQAEQRPNVERLSTMLGRDLTHWCSAQAQPA